jgi:hypothetical protein
VREWGSGGVGEWGARGNAAIPAGPARPNLTHSGLARPSPSDPARYGPARALVVGRLLGLEGVYAVEAALDAAAHAEGLLRRCRSGMDGLVCFGGGGNV